MKKNVVIGSLVILVLLLAITAEIFYLVKVRPRVTLGLQGFTGEEQGLINIENGILELNDEALLDEIDDVFIDVFDIMSSDRAVDEKSLTNEEALADISVDLDAQTTDGNNFKEMEQTLNELSF